MPSTTEFLNESCDFATHDDAIIGYVSAQDRQQLDRACRDYVPVALASNPDDALLALRSTKRFRTLVVGDDLAASTLPLLAEAAVCRPEVAVVAFADFGTAEIGALAALALVGADQFIFRGTDTSRIAVRAILRDAWLLRMGKLAGAAAMKCLPPTIEAFVRCAVRHPEHASTIGGVATLLGVNRRTLVNLCLREALPPPSEILTICRLALAITALEHSMCTVETIALDFGFASGTALRNQLKRHLGSRATDLRSCAGTERALEKLQCRILQTRSAQTFVPNARTTRGRPSHFRDDSRDTRVALGCYEGHPDRHIVTDAIKGTRRIVDVHPRRMLLAALAHRPPRLLLLPTSDAAGFPTIPLAVRCAHDFPSTTIAMVVASRYSGHRPLAEALVDGVTVLCASSADELRHQIDRFTVRRGVPQLFPMA
jgi:AraC-like DNA-binding protein